MPETALFCNIAGMIPGRHLGFVCMLALFVDNYYPDVVAGSKNRASRADNYAGFAGAYALVLISPLSEGKTAVNNSNGTSEKTAELADSLGSKSYFRHEQYRSLSDIPTMLDKFYEHGSLAASGYPVEQRTFRAVCVKQS